MALSASVDFSVTRDDLIKAGLQHIGAIGDGDTPNVTQLSESAILINMLIKHWKTYDIQLWVRKYGFVLPVSNVSQVIIGAEGGHAVTGYDYTTTSVISTSGTSTVTVTTVTGISAGDQIGIELEDGTMQWTTINGAPAGSVVTLTASLSDDVAVGAAVYTYTQSSQRGTRPAKILEAWRRQSSETAANVLDTPMTMLSEQDYNNLPNKGENGPPIQYWPDQTLGLSTSGHPGNLEFNFWPRFESGDYVIVYRYIKIFDDLDAATNDVEFPQEWFLPLMIGLAWLLSAKHGIPLKERQMLFNEMQFLALAARDYDQEQGSIFLSPVGEGG